MEEVNLLLMMESVTQFEEGGENRNDRQSLMGVTCCTIQGNSSERQMDMKVAIELISYVGQNKKLE